MILYIEILILVCTPEGKPQIAPRQADQSAIGDQADVSDPRPGVKAPGGSDCRGGIVWYSAEQGADARAGTRGLRSAQRVAFQYGCSSMPGRAASA